MFPTTYFGIRYYTTNYWPPGGVFIPPVVPEEITQFVYRKRRRLRARKRRL